MNIMMLHTKTRQTVVPDHVFFFFFFFFFYMQSTSICLFVLGHKGIVEIDNPLNPVGARSEESGPEVQGVLLLPEPRAGDDTDSGGFEETHAVEFVRGAVFGCGGLNGFDGEGDCGEEVHGTLYVLLE